MGTFLKNLVYMLVALVIGYAVYKFFEALSGGTTSFFQNLSSIINSLNPFGGGSSGGSGGFGSDLGGAAEGADDLVTGNYGPTPGDMTEAEQLEGIDPSSPFGQLVGDPNVNAAQSEFPGLFGAPTQ